MNTLTSRGVPKLKEGDNKVLFADKDIEFGFLAYQLDLINEYWDQGKGINYIARKVKRNPHEVFFSLYERWMDGEINDIERAFSRGQLLLVPGKDLLRRMKHD